MERLQKVMAHAGVASRRKCEEIILAGRVEVNDRLVNTLGVKVDPQHDVIKVDGREITKEKKVYLLLNKPKSVITSTEDPKGRRTVLQFITGVKERVYPVGRLDYDSEGLLLLSNDGDFMNAMTHPKHQVPKTYHATVKGVPKGDVLERLANGIQLEDGLTAPAEVEYFDVAPDYSQAVIAITLYEGRNRQVRRMFEAVNFPVQRLRRVQIGDLTLQGVGRGKFRHLLPEEVKALLQYAVTHKSHKK